MIQFSSRRSDPVIFRGSDPDPVNSRGSDPDPVISRGLDPNSGQLQTNLQAIVFWVSGFLLEGRIQIQLPSRVGSELTPSGSANLL